MCFYPAERGAGVIPFIALSPPVATSLPFLSQELLSNAGLLQVRSIDLRHTAAAVHRCCLGTVHISQDCQENSAASSS